jgi:CheY-like chemotaxis protein
MNECVARTGEAASARAAPTILIVEDDVLIRIAAADYLRSCGLTVLEAVDVPEALAVLDADNAVRLVFSDVRLPGPRSGLDLMKLIRHTYPHVRILLTSGVTKVDETTLEGVTLLRKPYFLFEVERHVATLLARPAEA